MWQKEKWRKTRRYKTINEIKQENDNQRQTDNYHIGRDLLINVLEFKKGQQEAN